MTNRFAEIEFGRQDEGEPQQTQVYETLMETSNAIIGSSETIEYYKQLIESLTSKIERLRKKIQHSRKIQTQFAMLLNKTVENYYGRIYVEPPIQKQAVPPLPPINKESRTEIIHLIHNSTPSEIATQIDKSNIIPSLLFSDNSIFDQRFVESLTRTSPDVQVAFFNETFKKVRKCSEFIHQMIPLLSQFCNDSSLHSQISDSGSDFSQFFKNYYFQVLSQIAQLINYTTCKIVYSIDSGKSLLLPTDTFSLVIKASDSVCYSLFKKKTNQISFPQKNPAFEIISEGPLFEEYKYVISSAFYFPSSSVPAGIVMLFSNNQFSDVDLTNLSVIVDFLSPLFQLYRSLFLKISPTDFSILSNSISSLRMSNSITPSFPEHICKICSASQCKLVLIKPNPAFSNLPVLQADQPSLINLAIQSGSTLSFKNARLHPQFNKNIDDFPSLPKISSMLIIPIKNCEFVIILYNSTISSEFTPIQKALAEYFSLSLPPLIHQLTIKGEMEEITNQQKCETKQYQKSINLILPIFHSFKEGQLFEFVKHILNEDETTESPFNIFVYHKISDEEALRYPGCDLVSLTENLTQKDDTFFETDDFDLNIEAGGDQSVKKIMVLSTSLYAVVLMTKENEFKQTELSLYRHVLDILLMLAPIVSLDHSYVQSKANHQNLRDSIRLSTSSFSRLISAKIDIKFFDPPLTDDPEIDGAVFTASVETKRGIEAVLVLYEEGDDIKEAAMMYGEWLMTVLSNPNGIVNHVDENDLQSFTEFLVKAGVLDVFQCSREKLELWIKSVLPLNPEIKVEHLLFVQDLIENESLSTFFTKTMKLFILLVCFLKGIEQNWKAMTDEKTVQRLTNCAPRKCPILAAVFGYQFGLADNLCDEDIDELITIMNDFVPDLSNRDEISILAHLRAISVNGFNATSSNLKWLGQALTLFTRICRFVRKPSDNEDISTVLIKELGEQKSKTELFMAERIFLPLILFLSTKIQSLKEMHAIVKTSIIEAKKTIH